MQKLRKLLPLWVALGILLVVGGIVFGLDRLQAEQEKVDAAAVVVPLKDGVWKLHPTREPERIHAWQSDEHFIVIDNRYTALFDSGDILIYENEPETLLTLAEDQPIAHELGTAGVLTFRDAKHIDLGGTKIIRNGYFIIYLHEGSGRMEPLAWSEDPVSVWTASIIGHAGYVQTFDLPIAPQVNWEFVYNAATDDVDSITQREDGKVRTVSTNLTHNSSRPRSQWFTAAQEQQIELTHTSYSITTISEDKVVWQRNEAGCAEETQIRSRKAYIAYRFPHRHTDERYDHFYFLSPAGSLYYHSTTGNECVDRFSGIDKNAFASALISDQYFALPADSGTQVYAWFRGYDWVQFDIPAAKD